MPNHSGSISTSTISRDAGINYRLSSRQHQLILWSPLAIAIAQALLLVHPLTRSISLWMLLENRPVELLTFIALFAAGLKSISLARTMKSQKERFMVYGFYFALAAGLLLIAMEEISWGQRILRFETPEAFKTLNQQGETTLHNLPGLQGNSEVMRLIFGVGGLIGICLSAWEAFKKIGVPLLLVVWFIVITIHASVDWYSDFYPFEEPYNYLLQRTSELVELMIADSG